MSALISPLPIFSVAMDSMSVVHLYFFISMECRKRGKWVSPGFHLEAVVGRNSQMIPKCRPCVYTLSQLFTQTLIKVISDFANVNKVSNNLTLRLSEWARLNHTNPLNLSLDVKDGRGQHYEDWKWFYPLLLAWGWREPCDKEYRWSLGAERSLQLIANKETGSLAL